VVLTRGKSLKRVKKSKSKVINPENIIVSKRQRKTVVVEKVTKQKRNPKPAKKVVIKAQVTVPALKAERIV
jgi:hypothetical protein